MFKHIDKIILVILALFLIGAACIYVSAEEAYTKGYITVQVAENANKESYDAIVLNNEIFTSPSVIAKLIKMEMTQGEDSIIYSGYAGREIDVSFAGEITTRGTSLEAQVHNISGEVYFPLAKILYLAGAQWCVEDNVIKVQATEKSIFDFIEKYGSEMQKRSITQVDLTTNEKNGVMAALKAVYNDLDERIFIPTWKEDISQDLYKKILLEMPKGELDLMNEINSGELNVMLTGSDFADKAEWDFSLSDQELIQAGGINGIYSAIKESKKGVRKFSEYNKINFALGDFKTIFEKIEFVSTTRDIAKAFTKINEKATRSKEWNEDFLAQVNILAKFDDSAHNRFISYNIKQASSAFLIEHSNKFATEGKKYLDEVVKMGSGVLVEQPPKGAYEDVVGVGLAVAGLRDEKFQDANNVEALSEMAKILAKIEHIAFYEMWRDIDAVKKAEKQGGSSLSQITKLRNSATLALRINLRSKTCAYYLALASKQDAKTIEKLKADILWDYVKIAELGYTEPYDKLVVAHNFSNMYSDEYGLKREGLHGNVLTNKPIGNTPEWAEKLTRGYWVSDIQALLVYKFYENGTVNEYSTMPDCEGEITENELAFSKRLNYAVEGNVLHIYGEGVDTKLKWVSRDEPYKWDGVIVNKLPESGNFFYETQWQGQGNAFYLARDEYYTEEETKKEPDWVGKLTQGYWVNNIQSRMTYVFSKDGTVTSSNGITRRYAVVGDVLRIYGDGYESRLKWVTRDEPYDWDPATEYDLPRNGGFFYQEGWEKSDDEEQEGQNAVYLRREDNYPQ